MTFSALKAFPSVSGMLMLPGFMITGRSTSSEPIVAGKNPPERMIQDGLSHPMATDSGEVDPIKKEYVRKRTTTLIELRLLHQKQRNDRNNEVRQINMLAQTLEKHLFKTASWEVYSDHNTLQARIKLLIFDYGRRRKKKQEREQRLTVLKAILGQKKYMKVLLLVKEIRALQVHRCVYQREGTFFISGKPTKDIPGQQQIPSAVRGIYFDTQLIVSVESTQHAEQLASLDWDNMINIARDNIDKYNEWQEEQVRRGSGDRGKKRSASGSLEVIDDSKYTKHIKVSKFV